MTGTKQIITIFGGTGDLTYRKLLPSLYDLFVTQSLPESFEILIIGRRDYTQEFYIETLIPWLNQARHTNEGDQVAAFLKHVHYVKMDIETQSDYAVLKQIQEAILPGAKTSYYLAVAPALYITITCNLAHYHMTETANVIIEKPFGEHIESVKQINDVLTKQFKPENIYRIDHYVAKEMVQNLFTIRFANPIFKSIWNRQWIDNIQFTAAETVGVETRGGFYDQTGALKDMFQNHLLQVLSIAFMEEPKTMSAQAIHEQQQAFMASLSVEDFTNDVVFGQYDATPTTKAYIEEDLVNPSSKTETFVALKLQSSLDVWKDTPFYVRTGKRLSKRYSEIVIQFKSLEGQPANLLIIKIQPDEGVYLKFNVKNPGKTVTSQEVFMDYCQSCNIDFRTQTPEAYERLLEAVLQEDQTLFSSYEEVLMSWEFVSEIIEKTAANPVHLYPAGTMGPDASNTLLNQSDRYWIEESVYGELYETEKISSQ